MIKRIISWIMVWLVSSVTATAPMPQPVAMNVDSDPDFVPVLRFVVGSDSHIRQFGDIHCQRIMNMIETGYAAAEASDSYKKLDAVVMVGDLTDNGSPKAFAALKASVNHVLRDDTDYMAVVAKSHDSNKGRISRAYISNITGDSADFHKVIHGFHFIGVSASGIDFLHYSQSQIRWLDKQLEMAVKEDPNKPVFVFQHEHIRDTVYGSTKEDGWGVTYFTKVLEKYPQVVDMSGHSHYPANDPRSIWQGAFTAINDGGLNYYEFTVDGQNEIHPEAEKTQAQMLLVEVNAENCVRVQVCDLNEGKVMVSYDIDNIAEPNKTKYAPATRKAAATAPVFESGMEVKVKGKTVQIQVPAAVPGADDVVFLYRLEVVDATGKTVYKENQIGDYYKHWSSEGAVFTMELAPGIYTVRVIAQGAWGPTSAPLIMAFVME